MNPYNNLPLTCRWSSAVSEMHPGLIDLSYDCEERITESDGVFSMGSCFAQYIAAHLKRISYNYLRYESDHLCGTHGSLFSANYGNVYSARQARQLFERAFGLRGFDDHVWLDFTGQYLDAFRPRVFERGFDTVVELSRARVSHLNSVARLVREADWFVFTLGLTEGWESVSDSAVFPVAPGVLSDNFGTGAIRPVVWNYSNVMEDLLWICDFLRSVNPRLKLIITVSPVPLAATHQRQHVIRSSVLSKSILHVVANEVASSLPSVFYFPSFEIISSSAADGIFFNDDLRTISRFGVDCVMRAFDRTFLRRDTPQAAMSQPQSAVQCDEELLTRIDSQLDRLRKS